MNALAEFRKRSPQYDDLSDEQLARALHGKFQAERGATVPLEEFMAALGLKEMSVSAPSNEAAEINTPPAAAHDFSSTQLPVPAEAAGAIQAAARELIDPNDIDPENGLETDSHITLKYGLHTDAAQDVASLLEGTGPIRVRVQGVEVFEGVGDGRADAIVLRVESPKLRELNRRVGAELETTDTYPDYKPHITLGYVKAGQGQKYVGASTPLEGTTLTLSQVDFSARSGAKTPITLAGPQAPQKVPAEPAEPGRPLSEIRLTEQVQDEQGNVYEIARPAEEVVAAHDQRLSALSELLDCLAS